MSIRPIRLLRTAPPALLLAAALAFAPLHAGAHGASSDASTLSALSALSALPIAVSVAAPVAIVSGGALLTLVAVEAASDGAVWVLERASDGARRRCRRAPPRARRAASWRA